MRGARTRSGVAGLALAVVPSMAEAHASEQTFVLLLPTDVYAGAGVAVVILTVLALFALPDSVTLRLFSHAPRRAARDRTGLRNFTSVLSFVLLAIIVAVGIAGPRDPLSNIMPLTFWTVGWVGLVTLSGIFPTLWAWINPWTGLYNWLAPTWQPRTVRAFCGSQGKGILKSPPCNPTTT